MTADTMCADQPVAAAAAPDSARAPHSAPKLLLVSSAANGLEEQQAFLSDCERLLRKAACSGERLVIALFHILNAHRPALVEGGAHARYACRECRDTGRGGGSPYPCATAQEASWALEAVLR